MKTDVLIIGCGIGGASAALGLAQDREREIVVVTRAGDPAHSNSSHAQGGIVGRGEDDDVDLLVSDVVEAGAGLTDPAAARLLAEEGPALLERILVLQGGLEFDHDGRGKRVFGLEGAHSRRRILHVGDRTGDAIMRILLRQLVAQPNVKLMTGKTAVDLITFPHHSRDPMAVYRDLSCHGAYVFDDSTREVAPIVARSTVLATGGLGQIFLNTSNPAGSRGDGLAMGYRAGARVVNAEYVQFHPTTLHSPGTTKFLISEAVRGEGATLLTPDGRRFMEHHAPEWKELAPRDVVARAIFWEMLAHDYTHVLLDIASHKKPAYIRERFPQIYEHCLKHGLDITQRAIPVVPAAHYFCGGLRVDAWGRTTVPGLFAVGEVACTGVHGANRLASTSLLEGLVWGDRAARKIREDDPGDLPEESAVPDWDVADLRYQADPALIQGDMQHIRSLMWHYVGLVRAEYRLIRAIRELSQLALNIEDFYRRARLTDALIGLRNSVQAALLVARAARRNTVSRGCHYREDAARTASGSPPLPDNQFEPTSGPR